MVSGYRASATTAWLAGLFVLAAGTGCPRRTGDGTHGPGVTDTWQSFTDTDRHKTLIATGTHVWAGTDRGLLRWELLTGSHSTLSIDDGLAAQPIDVMALEPGGALWVAGKDGASRIESGRVTNMAGLAYPVKGSLRAMAVTEIGGEALHSWIASDAGLYRFAYGSWNLFSTEWDVRDVAAGASGEVWLATATQGVVILRAASATTIGEADGLPTRHVVEVAVTPGDRAVALLAENPKGTASKIALYDGLSWRGFAPVSDGSRLEMLSANDARTVVRLNDVFYEVAALAKGSDADIPDEDKSRVALDMISGKTASDSPTPFGYELRRIGAAPDRAIASAATVDPGGNLWIGTHNLGIAKIPARGGKATWLRTRDVLGRGRVLSLATDTRGRVILPARDNRVMIYDDVGWSEVAVDPDPTVVVDAVVNAPGGAVWALVRPRGTNVIKFLRLDGDAWTSVGDITVEVPRGVIEVGYVATTPSGKFWIAVSYRKGTESLPFGMVVVPETLDSVTHYRRRDKDDGSDPALDLPINDISAVTFTGDEAWLATFSGVYRMARSGKNTLYTENEGLESDITYDVVRTRDGVVWAATGGGIGFLDGESWVFDRKRGAITGKSFKALAVDGDGTLWGGTDLGLYRREKLGEWDKLGDVAGLLDDRVLDIAVDGNGRVWFLTPTAISMLHRR